MGKSIDINKLAIATSFLAIHVSEFSPEDNIFNRVRSCLRDKAFSYRPGTWRIRRNALAYAFACEGKHEEAEYIHQMVNPVTAPNADEATRALKPKKQPRTHRVINDEHEQIINYLHDIDDLPVLGAVTIASKIGVRPAEMASMKFDDSRQSIFITGAKKREKADRGIDRRLLLKGDDYQIVKEAWGLLMTEFNRTDALPERAMKRIQNRFYKQVRKIFDDRKSYPSLYSYRHQFGSDLKASGMDRITIAAIMGHASVESVNAYGDRRRGGRKMNIDVSDESLDAVRNIKVTTPPAKSVSAEKVDSEVTTDEIKAMTCPENTVVDEAESPFDQSEADNNQPNLNTHDTADTSSPEPYIKMIKGSKAIMF